LTSAVGVSWLLAYVASIGPAVAFDDWLVNWRAPGLDAVELVYFPLVWLCESRVVERLLKSYVDLWEDLASGRPSPSSSHIWRIAAVALLGACAALWYAAFRRDVAGPVEKRPFRERYRFRLRTLLFVVGGATVLFGVGAIVVRWHVAQQGERHAQRALGTFGGTFSMQSAVVLRETGVPANPLWSTFSNYVAEVDLSVDAWPIAAAGRNDRTYAKVTDEALPLLAGFAHLRVLDLHGQDVTDQGVIHLRRLRHLRRLNISGTQLSRAAVEELRSSLPECEVQH
ncbi:MAG: hypothetical protein AAF961_19320, partial [Planctomycetota bacterium]